MGRIVSRPEGTPLFAERRVDRPEDSVCFAVGWIALEGRLCRFERLTRAILTGIQRREFRSQFGRLRRERNRFLVRRDGLIYLLLIFEMPAEHEVVRGSAARRLRRRSLRGTPRRRRRDTRTR